MNSLVEQIFRNTALVNDPARWEATQVEHKKVVQALDENNLDRACEALRQHILSSKAHHVKRLTL
jgi:DNA-binding GntR family transcriptional regulator